MKGLRKAEAVIIAGFFAAALVFIGMMFMTADRWMHVERLHVADTHTAENFPIYYEREIKRPFFGKWLVELWQVSRGIPEAVCSASGQWNYEPNTPNPAQDWRWLVNDGACRPRGPGEYFARVVIDINPYSIMARRVVSESNVFRVLE